jgi:hypothetical protein
VKAGEARKVSQQCQTGPRTHIFSFVSNIISLRSIDGIKEGK